MILHLSCLHRNVNWKVYNDGKNISATPSLKLLNALFSSMPGWPGLSITTLTSRGSIQPNCKYYTNLRRFCTHTHTPVVRYQNYFLFRQVKLINTFAFLVHTNWLDWGFVERAQFLKLSNWLDLNLQVLIAPDVLTTMPPCCCQFYVVCVCAWIMACLSHITKWVMSHSYPSPTPAIYSHL